MLVSERFFSKFKILKNGCWEWTGAKFPSGYGGFSFNGKKVYAHRFAYQIFRMITGELRKDICVCHSCDFPSCVNPDHLWLGTMTENIADRDRKGRHVKAGQKRRAKM